MNDAFIYDAIRSPRGKGKKDGSLHELSAAKLSSKVLKELKNRNNLDTSHLSDVIWGNATQVAEQGGCLSRSALLLADYQESVPGLSINRFCASGLEAVNLAANQIIAGEGYAYVSGGVEMMSRVPMGSDGAAIAVDPELTMKEYFIPQGVSADLIATKYNFSRSDVDCFAVESQKRAFNASKNNFFSNSMIPIKDQNGILILDKDEIIRPETDLNTLSNLNPSFKEMGENLPGFDKVALLRFPEYENINHIHHAGNSSGIVDGAASILVGSKKLESIIQKKPKVRIVATQKIGCNPTMMLNGPVPVTKEILKKANMKISDIDIFEVNEAFASIVLMFMSEFNIHHDRVNVNGGAIAMGHPLGATGAIILGSAIDELERSNKNTALITLCVASGMGVATIIERV